MTRSKPISMLLSLAAVLAAVAPAGAAERLGIGILDLKSGKASYQNGQTSFPMQSVFKAPLAMAVLKAVDEGRLKLDQPITINRSDISFQWSPLAKKFKGESEQHTLLDLLQLTVEQSDNTSADVLMRLLGGPKAVNDALVAAGVKGMRVDRYEREFGPEVVGLRPIGMDETIDEAAFEASSKALPDKTKRQALEHFLYKDARDTSTPQAAVNFLSKLYKGELLSPPSTQLMLKMMSEAKTGQHRLIAGLPKGSTLAHKTGTGATILGVNVATNDIGIATLPDGRVVAIAVFLSGSQRPEQDRDRTIREIAEKVATKSGGI